MKTAYKELTLTAPYPFVLPSFCSYMALCPPVVSARWSLLSHATENYCNPTVDAWIVKAETRVDVKI